MATVLFLAKYTSLATPDCTVMLHRPTATHSEPATEQRGDVGSGVLVHGRILGAPDRVPFAGAKVAHWRADEGGFYTDQQ